MAAEAQIKAVITADDRASSTLRGFSTKIGDLSVGMAALGAGVMKVADMAFDFLGQSIKQFAEAERASRMLEHAVISVTGATREQLNATSKLAEAISAKGVLDDDVIKQGLAQLSTFRLSNGAVQGLAQSMADLTVNQFGVSATGEQAADAANMMAKALRGEFGMLQKSGIVFTDAQKSMILYGTETQKVAAINAGFAENLKYTNDIAAGTAEGGFARYMVAIGNMQESIGGALAPAVGILATKLTEFVNSDQFKAWLERVTVWIRDELPPFLERLFNEYIPKAKQAFDEWWPAIRATAEALLAVANAVGWVGSAINQMSSDAGLSFGFLVMWISNFIDRSVNNLTNFVFRVRAVFRDIRQGIVDALNGVVDLIIDPFKKAFDWVVNAARKVKDVLTGALDPRVRHSPSLVDNIAAGAQKVRAEYASLFSDVEGLGNSMRVADLNIAPNVAQTAPTQATQQTNSTINVSLSGVFTGSPGEARKLAEMVAQNLQTIAGQKNMSVTQMLG